MKVKVFYPNREGRIEFTRQELEKLLDEVYREGQKDYDCGKSLTWTAPYYNNSLISNNVATATAATPDLPVTAYAVDNNVIDDFKAATIKSNDNEANPYSITMKINEGDVNKAVKTLKAVFDQKGVLTPQKIEDVFSDLAKELSF